MSPAEDAAVRERLASRIRGYGNCDVPEEGATAVAQRAVGRLSEMIVEDVEGTFNDISENGLSATVKKQMSSVADCAHQELEAIVGWWRGETKEPPAVAGVEEKLSQLGGATGAAYGMTAKTATGGVQAVWVLPDAADPGVLESLAATVDPATASFAGVAFLVDLAANDVDEELAQKIVSQCAKSGTAGWKLAEMVSDRVLHVVASEDVGSVRGVVIKYLMLLYFLQQVNTELTREAVEGVKAKVGAQMLRCANSCDDMESILLRVGLKSEDADLLGFHFGGSSSSAVDTIPAQGTRRLEEAPTPENSTIVVEIENVINSAVPDATPEASAPIDLLDLETSSKIAPLSEPPALPAAPVIDDFWAGLAPVDPGTSPACAREEVARVSVAPSGNDSAQVLASERVVPLPSGPLDFDAMFANVRSS